MKTMRRRKMDVTSGTLIATAARPSGVDAAEELAVYRTGAAIWADNGEELFTLPADRDVTVGDCEAIVVWLLGHLWDLTFADGRLRACQGEFDPFSFPRMSWEQGHRA